MKYKFPEDDGTPGLPVPINRDRMDHNLPGSIRSIVWRINAFSRRQLQDEKKKKEEKNDRWGSLHEWDKYPHESDIEVIHQRIIPFLQTFCVGVFGKGSLDAVIVTDKGLKDRSDIDLVNFQCNLYPG